MGRNLLLLPDEILLCIFNKLSTKTLAKVVRVSRRTHAVATEVLYTLDDSPRFGLRYALEMAANANGEPLMLKILERSMKTIKLSPPRQFDALVYSCTYGFENAVRRLLDAQIPPDPDIVEVEDQWTTPLTGAIHARHTGIIEMLLRAGANLKRYNFDNTMNIICQTPKIIARELVPGLDLSLLDAHGNTILHAALHESDCTLEDITILLDNNLNPNVLNSLGQTPIAMSIYIALDSSREEAEVIALLLYRFPHIANSVCDEEYYPIHLACEVGTPAIVQLLLESGADPNIRNTSTGETALSTLAQRDDESTLILVALLTAGISLSTDARSIETFLSLAIQNGWLDSLSILYYGHASQLEQLNCHDLIFAGAAALGDVDMLRTMVLSGLVDVNSMEHGTTPLIEACRQGKEAAVKFLVNEARVSNFDAEDIHSKSALHAAILCGPDGEGIVRFLLPYVTFDNTPDANSHIPLVDAVYNQPVAVVSLLIDRLVELKHPRAVLEESLSSAMCMAVNRNDREAVALLADRLQRLGLAIVSHYAPTFDAIDQTHWTVAHMLIDRGIAIENTRDSFSPLMCALAHAELSIVRKLISLKVDLNVVSRDGDTALKIAASTPEDATFVRDLIHNQVDVNLGEEIDEAPINIAVTQGNASIVLLLLAAGARAQDNLLHDAANLYNQDTLKVLLLHGLNVNAPSHPGCESPLFRAAYHGKVHNVRLLLNNGANPNQLNHIQRSPLSAAVLGGKFHAVEMLLTAGANVNQAEVNGSTPLLLASRTGRTGIIGLLIQYGANVNHISNTGWSALANAVSKTQADTIRLLLAYGADPKIQVPIPGYSSSSSPVEKESLLHLAVRAGCADIVQILVDARCCPHVADSLGRTPLELAVGDEVYAALYSRHPAVRKVSTKVMSIDSLEGIYGEVEVDNEELFSVLNL